MEIKEINHTKIKLIYILGTSYSGSTLLGFLLGAPAEVVFVGELKALPQRKTYKICTCGKQVTHCDFWQKYFDSDLYNYGKPTRREKARLSWEVLKGTKIQQNTIPSSVDLALLHMMKQDFSDKNQQPTYLIDSSKSLWRLMHLLQCQDIEISIAYLKRDFKHNVASFKKRSKGGFWKGIFIYKFNHLLIRRFLKTNQIPYAQVQYEELCAQPQQVLNSLGAAWGINYQKFQTQLPSRSYHVQEGNPGTRLQFRDGFSGIQRVQDSWKRKMNALEIAILRLLSNWPK